MSCTFGILSCPTSFRLQIRKKFARFLGRWQTVTALCNFVTVAIFYYSCNHESSQITSAFVTGGQLTVETSLIGRVSRQPSDLHGVSTAASIHHHHHHDLSIFCAFAFPHTLTDSGGGEGGRRTLSNCKHQQVNCG